VKAIGQRSTLKIPHMGRNTLASPGRHPLLEGIKTGPDACTLFRASFHLPRRIALP